MSSDEAAAIIGRMMLERKTLQQQEVALGDELGKLGDRLGILGRKLRSSPTSLETSEITNFDPARISQLVDDLKTVKQRLEQLNTGLEKAGAF